MPWKEPNDQEFYNVLKLEHEKRIEYFFKRCVDLNAVWVAEDAEGLITFMQEDSEILPIWPARRFAEACLPKSEWPGIKYQTIELDEWCKVTIQRMAEESIKIGIFGTPEGDILVLSSPEARDAFEAELNTRLFRSPNWDEKAERGQDDLMDLLKPAMRASMKAKPKGKLP